MKGWFDVDWLSLDWLDLQPLLRRDL